MRHGGRVHFPGKKQLFQEPPEPPEPPSWRRVGAGQEVGEHILEDLDCSQLRGNEVRDPDAGKVIGDVRGRRLVLTQPDQRLLVVPEPGGGIGRELVERGDLSQRRGQRRLVDRERRDHEQELATVRVPGHPHAGALQRLGTTVFSSGPTTSTAPSSSSPVIPTNANRDRTNCCRKGSGGPPWNWSNWSSARSWPANATKSRACC